MTWYEIWECENRVENNPAFLEKVHDPDRDAFESMPLPQRNCQRASAWERNHSFMAQRLRRFNRITKGIYSVSLWHYYRPDEAKPTKIKAIHGDFHYFAWAGPGWGKEKKRITNRKARHKTVSDLPSKGRFYVKEAKLQSFD